MATRTAAAKRPYATGPVPIEYEARSTAYGGLVGQMIGEIDTRMATGAAPATAPATAIADSGGASEDFIHAVSVVCGYVGLITGFAAAAAAIFLVL